MKNKGGWIANMFCNGSSNKACEKTCGLCGNWLAVLILNVIGLGLIWSLFFSQKKNYCPDISCNDCWFVPILNSLGFGCPTFVCIALLAFFSTALVAAPLIRFIHGGWHTRYEEFRNRLSGNTLGQYLYQYWEKMAIEEGALIKNANGKNHIDDVKADALFDKIYNEHYGKNAFRVPNILLIMLVFVAASLIALGEADIVKFPSDFPLHICVAAFSGAYMFIVSDLVLLVRRRWLNVTDIYWYALRMLLAVPIAMTVTGASNDKSFLTFATAFAVCFLPVDVLVKMIRRIGSKSFGEAEAQQDSDALLNLEGVTVPIASMLLAEGINSIDQLIGTDPVLLSIRTGLPFKFVLNLVSQAVVRRHLGESAVGLIPLDLATCEQVDAFISKLNHAKKDEKEVYIGTLGTAAANMNAVYAALANKGKTITALTIDAQSLKLAFEGITNDSFSKFLRDPDQNPEYSTKQ